MCRIFGHKWHAYMFHIPVFYSYCSRCFKEKTECLPFQLDESYE